MKFKEFLLTEGRQFLAHKIGDILTAVHELLSGGKQIGARQLVKHSEGVVNHIRKVLHTSWSRSDQKYLKKLQKCGVALMKTIDEKGDLQQTLNGVRSELEKLSGKLGEPVNKLANPPDEQPVQPKVKGQEAHQLSPEEMQGAQAIQPAPQPNE
jgi:hypothetical protein